MFGPRKKHWKVKCPLETLILKVLLPAFGTAGTHPQVHWVDDVGCAHCIRKNTSSNLQCKTHTRLSVDWKAAMQIQAQQDELSKSSSPASEPTTYK